MFYENLGYGEMLQKLWESNKITAEDREWVDKISSRKSLKFSEGDRLVKLMFKTFGPPSFQ